LTLLIINLKSIYFINKINLKWRFILKKYLYIIFFICIELLAKSECINISKDINLVTIDVKNDLHSAYIKNNNYICKKNYSKEVKSVFCIKEAKYLNMKKGIYSNQNYNIQYGIINLYGTFDFCLISPEIK
jgi:hypothetical protein